MGLKNGSLGPAVLKKFRTRCFRKVYECNYRDLVAGIYTTLIDWWMHGDKATFVLAIVCSADLSCRECCREHGSHSQVSMAVQGLENQPLSVM